MHLFTVLGLTGRKHNFCMSGCLVHICSKVHNLFTAQYQTHPCLRLDMPLLT